MPTEEELQAQHGVPERLPPATAQPCKECPWRRGAAPGWLGPMKAEDWIDLAQSDMPVMCHRTIKESENYEGTFQCRGAAIFRANICKSPRREDAALGPVDNDLVFATTREFLDYHKGGLASMEDGERIVNEYEGWINGEEVIYVGPSTEEISEGEEGTIEINEVGGAEYGNLRTAIFFKPEGANEALTEVSPMHLEGI